MEKPNFYGIMPADVRYDKNLKPMEKILYTEITALTNSKGYCFATNSYFAELYEVHKNTVGNWISNLEKQGYIKTVLIYKNGTKEISERRIYINQKNITPINEKVDTYQQKDCDPINEKVEDNNTRLILNNNIIYLFKSSEFKEKFDYFVQQRKLERKKESKDLGILEIDLYQKRLYELSKGDEKEALKILEKAIMRNWKDFYIEEGNNGNNFNTRYSRKKEDKHSKKPDYTKGFDDWN
jgi:hypothetical protein